MSKHKTIDVWNRVFGAKQEAHDYTADEKVRLRESEQCLSPDD